MNKTEKEKDRIGKDNVPTHEIAYQDELHKKLAGLLAQPTTPVVAPPSVMRVLMLPYKGDENELFMLRYVYIIVDGPKWVMGDYLFKEKDGK
jgi:conjugal transfer pilus assembly protein TraV